MISLTSTDLYRLCSIVRSQIIDDSDRVKMELYGKLSIMADAAECTDHLQSCAEALATEG